MLNTVKAYFMRPKVITCIVIYLVVLFIVIYVYGFIYASLFLFLTILLKFLLGIRRILLERIFILNIFDADKKNFLFLNYPDNVDYDEDWLTGYSLIGNKGLITYIQFDSHVIKIYFIAHIRRHYFSISWKNVFNIKLLYYDFDQTDRACLTVDFYDEPLCILWKDEYLNFIPDSVGLVDVR